ncbi:accessory regulator AgrC [Campylobacter coli]|uniref:Accessory regulator AgrC n=1 Tax=Campylobacter coli TaxID=195 RepID=A0A5T0RFT1_CAMCO|nr:accessory regulator AgrC [Campylobacter coli]ECB9791435.1 accessory regulator AgrC [Campylobacter coli]EEL0707827.1 accessory regulator AgrC [Campylobacter coli]EGD4023992.1 accessory regulator AgrC [Campylobacter coli]EGK8231105.1 accessory regulator AgrC [Campylobacter coli]
MFIYFLIWQVLFVLGWNLRFILKLIMGEDVFIENFILDKIISVAYIIIAFFFFKTLVQATKEKLFYLVFAFFVCGEIVSKLFFAFIRLLDSIRLQEMIVEIIFYICILFTPAYFISFLIVWLSLKGQKEVKKAI